MGRRAAAFAACGLLAACGLSAVGSALDEPSPIDRAIDAGPDGGDSDAFVDSGATLDADAGDADVTTITLVQSGQNIAVDAGVVAATIQATTASDFVAVMVTMFRPQTATVTSITDNAPGGSNVYVSAGVRSTVGVCQSSEIWYARAVKTGATSVTATLSAEAIIQLWVLELSGLSATGAVDVLSGDSGAPTTVVYAPAVHPSGVPAVIVNATGSCMSVTGLHPGSAFTLLPIQRDNGASYFIANEAGTFGPVYDTTDASWNGSTAAFR